MAKPAARSIWSGSIRCGLVVLPVKLYSATDEGGGVAFNQVCREHTMLVKQPKVCTHDGHAVTPADLVKGFPVNDKMVVIEPAELDKLPLATTKQLDVTQFVPLDEISDPVMHKATYYMMAEPVGTRAFAMLRDALAQTGRAGVGKIALRSGREQLAALTSNGVQMRLTLLYWPDEIRSDDPFSDQLTITDPAEVKQATALIEAMFSHYTPSQFHDEWREAVLALIDSKVNGTAAPAPAPTNQGSAIDLMAALKASVQAATQATRKEKTA